jgi:hypothetical protein
MRPDHGAVEHEPLQVGVLQDLEHPLPDPLLAPAIEPLPDGVPVAEAFGEVAPGGAGLGDPEHGVDARERDIVIIDRCPRLNALSYNCR